MVVFKKPSAKKMNTADKINFFIYCALPPLAAELSSLASSTFKASTSIENSTGKLGSLESTSQILFEQETGAPFTLTVIAEAGSKAALGLKMAGWVAK